MEDLFLQPCTAFMVWYLCKGTFLCLHYQDKHLLFEVLHVEKNLVPLSLNLSLNLKPFYPS